MRNFMKWLEQTFSFYGESRSSDKLALILAFGEEFSNLQPDKVKDIKSIKLDWKSVEDAVVPTIEITF